MTAAASDQAARLRQLFASAEQAPAVSLTPVPVGPAAPMLTIASGKGGVGKTSLAVNLSIALTQIGCRSTLLDADIGTANADVLCGITPRTRLDNLLRQDRTTSERLAIPAPGGFTLLPGAVGLTRLGHLSDDDRDRVLKELAELETTTDLFLIDAGAGVGPDVQTFIDASDGVLIVITPEPTSIADAYALVKSVWARRRKASTTPSRALNDLHGRWWVVVNSASHEAEAFAAHAKLASCAQRFLGEHLPLLGWVHNDKRVAQAVRRRRPFLLDARLSRPSREVRALARDVLQLTHRLGVQHAAHPKRR